MYTMCMISDQVSIRVILGIVERVWQQIEEQGLSEDEWLLVLATHIRRDCPRVSRDTPAEEVEDLALTFASTVTHASENLRWTDQDELRREFNKAWTKSLE